MKKKNVQICISSYLEEEWNIYTRDFVQKLLFSDVHNFIDYRVSRGPHIDFNRNYSVDPTLSLKPNLNPNITHFLHLDVDNEPTEDDIYKLLSYDLDFVSAVYPMNGDPDRLVAIDIVGEHYSSKNHPSGLLEVRGNGLGAVVISARMYNTIPKPWYESKYFRLPDGTLKYVHEDMYFCEKARQFGFNIYADFSVLIKHRIRDNKSAEKSYQLRGKNGS